MTSSKFNIVQTISHFFVKVRTRLRCCSHCVVCSCKCFIAFSLWWLGKRLLKDCILVNIVLWKIGIFINISGIVQINCVVHILFRSLSVNLPSAQRKLVDKKRRCFFVRSVSNQDGEINEALNIRLSFFLSRKQKHKLLFRSAIDVLFTYCHS